MMMCVCGDDEKKERKLSESRNPEIDSSPVPFNDVSVGENGRRTDEHTRRTVRRWRKGSFFFSLSLFAVVVGLRTAGLGEPEAHHSIIETTTVKDPTEKKNQINHAAALLCGSRPPILF
jgi:hypothetical protein